MQNTHFFSDKKLLLRQVISAWVILITSVILFVLFALLLSLIVLNHELIIMISLLLVIPFLVGSHIFLATHSYRIKISKPLQKEAVRVVAGHKTVADLQSREDDRPNNIENGTTNTAIVITHQIIVDSQTNENVRPNNVKSGATNTVIDSPINEASLVLQAQQGSDEAFARLVEQYHTPVYLLCYRMLGEVEYAEDATQESFLRVYRNLARYDRQRPFATWLLSITAHYCIDSLRRRRFTMISKDIERDDDERERPMEFPDVEALNPEQEAIHNEEQTALQNVLQQLDATDRAAVVLRYWYDFSEIEISQSLSLTVSAVKSRLHRARKEMARRLAASSLASSLAPPIDNSKVAGELKDHHLTDS